MTVETTLHETSLAIWDVPSAVAAGECLTVRVGARRAAGWALSGCAVEGLARAGAALASGRRGGLPWPGPAALFWTELELCAPLAPGLATFAARLDPAGLQPPHRSASLPFSMAVVAPPEHTLIVTVAANGAPIEEAYIRLGPLRAMTDSACRAAIELANGRFEL